MSPRSNRIIIIIVISKLGQTFLQPYLGGWMTMDRVAPKGCSWPQTNKFSCWAFLVVY